MKRITAFLAAIIITVTFFGCGKSDDQKEDYTLWQSTTASMNDTEVDFSEDGMVMNLAFFDDGIYQMSVEIQDVVLENFPQEGSYTVEDGVYSLDSGWKGNILEDGTMDLAFSDGENSVVFHCVKSE